MNYVNINGKITLADDAQLPVDNGAFRYGYGLFETMLVQDRVINLADYHWERLFTGADQLYFEQPALMTEDWLEEQVLRTVSRNNLEALCRVRLQLFAGGGGFYSADSYKPGLVIECFPLEAEALTLNDNGLVAGIATGIGKCIDTIKNLKTCNALIYALAAKQARQNKWNDALLCNTDSRIIESTIANIFWIKEGIIYTPPLTDGCIAGVMRRHVMEQIAVVEKSLTVYELLKADEVFLTNAIKKMRWVKNISDSLYTNTMIKNLFQKL